MGYWKINNIRKGQIDINNEMEDKLINGDPIADILEDAIDNIVKQYEHDLKRKPYMEELYAAFRFVFNASDKTRKLEYFYKDKMK